MEVLVFYSSCKKKKKSGILYFYFAQRILWHSARWFVPIGLSLNVWIFEYGPVETLSESSCLGQFHLALVFFHRGWKVWVVILSFFLVPCILVRTLFSSGLLALPAIGNVHLKQKKNVAPPYLSSVGAWVSTAVFSIRAICHTARKRRWWETKQTAVWVENWSWYWNCIIQASSRLGRGGWSGGLGNAMPAWTGGKTRAWRSLSSLSSPAHVWIFMVSGKQVHGCLLHCAEGSRAACRYCCSPLKWT